MVDNKTGVGIEDRGITGLFKGQEIPLTKDVFVDRSIVKVFDSIAGAGKSTIVHGYFSALGEDYVRATSTNRLAMDCQSRFSTRSRTIASELFRTQNGCFYSERKDTDFENIVIDEILQSDGRVFDWIEENIGKKNIIVCTDSNQMLSQSCADIIMKRFAKLKKISFAINLTKTYRAIDEETSRMYSYLYSNCGCGNLFNRVYPSLNKAYISDISYRNECMYICHSNDIELYIYKKFDLFLNYGIPLVPKGNIAKKVPKHLDRYPIVPQAMVSRNTSGYFQVANVGTPTRMQGGECEKDGCVYFFIEKNSRISDREIYTAFTRVRVASNFFIVEVDLEAEKRVALTVFNGKPVKDAKYMIIDKSFVVDGERLDSLVERDDSGLMRVTADVFKKIVSSFPESATTHFKDNGFIMNGEFVTSRAKHQELPKINVLSLVSKSPDLDISYMDDFMFFFEKSQRENMRRVYVDSIVCPMCCYQGRRKDSPFPDSEGYSSVIRKEEYAFGLDLKSSYIHALNNMKIPNTHKISESKISGGIDWFILYSTQLPPGCLATGDLVKEISATEDVESYYVCSTSCSVSSVVAERWHKECHKDKEANADLKEIFWGVLEKPWLSGCNYSDGISPEYYVRDKANRFQLLACAIKSAQAKTMIRVRKEIYGSIYDGYMLADCIYFNYKGDISELGTRISRKIPGYDFRIFENGGEKKVLFRTYDELVSRAELKRRKESDRRKKRLHKNE